MSAVLLGPTCTFSNILLRFWGMRVFTGAPSACRAFRKGCPPLGKGGAELLRKEGEDVGKCWSWMVGPGVVEWLQGVCVREGGSMQLKSEWLVNAERQLLDDPYSVCLTCAQSILPAMSSPTHRHLLALGLVVLSLLYVKTILINSALLPTAYFLTS